MTFDMMPLLAISTATLVAFVSYLVSLCKYFYISPFVTAWAMATKRTDKIIDFLLMGISVFLRPILIVLFVYLALFMYVLVDEFFVFVATNQFSGIQTDITDFHTNFIVSSIAHSKLTSSIFANNNSCKSFCVIYSLVVLPLSLIL